MNKIIINGIEYDINVVKAIELGVLTKSREKISVGQRFVRDNTIYILSLTAGNEHGPGTVIMISLANGNRWANGIYVVDPQNISDDEFLKLTGESIKYTKFVKQ